MSTRIFRLVFAGFVAGVPVASQEVSPTRVANLGAEQRIVLDGRPVAFEGFVYTPDGAPAEGAVVMTSAGGLAVVDLTGHYFVEARLPRDAESVQVTAVGHGGRNPTATAKVAVSAGSTSVRVDPLALALGSSCSPSWLPTFGGAPGTNNSIVALAVHDDGGGRRSTRGATSRMRGASRRAGSRAGTARSGRRSGAG